MKMTFEEALNFLYENLHTIFSVAEIILLSLLAKHRKDKVVEVKQDIPVASEPEKVDPKPISNKSLKNQLKSQLQADLDLLFSDKDDAELSEEETLRVSKLVNYLTGGQQI